MEKDKLKNAYAILIGVGADLKESVIDAKSIYDILIDDNLCGYKKENVFLITEEEATKDNILKTLETLKNKVDFDSSVLLFYSGHGGYHEGADIYYLQPNDFTPENYIDAKDLRQLINEMRSKRMVLFLDCCHAAGMFKQGVGKYQTQLTPSVIPEDNFNKIEGLAQKIDNDQGISIVSSCRENQLSWIMDGDENSLFTKCLLEVLKGTHKTYFEDEFIRISEVVHYIFKRVPEIQPSQNPYVNLQIYDDFVLSNVPKNLHDNISHTLTNSSDNKHQQSSKSLIQSYRDEENNKNLILFVHGFTGEGNDSFGKFPEFLLTEQGLKGWDIKPIGYAPNVVPELGKDVWSNSTDIEKISQYLITCMKYKYEKYKRVAIIAHSLGGLVVQKAIVDMDKGHRNKISHVILFGCPSLGIDSEVLENLWKGRYKEMDEKGEFITDLREKWDEIFSNTLPFKLKTVAGTEDNYISYKSCHDPFPKDTREFVTGDHFTMVKPQSTDEAVYKLILGVLTGNEFFKDYAKSAEINMLIGNYEEVINELFPKKEHLDANGLRNLVFALEGTDRSSEIYDLLNDHPLLKNNSDFMGILGGRHKREYLKTYSQSSGEKALEFYSKGYQMAKNDKNDSQIYYHAINLAFLNLVLKRDESKMKSFAEEAKSSAENCRDNLWKFATLGEASIYLDSMEDAEELYVKAARQADIRQKISMFTNAYTSYAVLMDGVSEHDRFAKFLKTTLLN
ncbi:caspase family protein [Aegicerativicinus sediminis]|uniref:caspase family protein n=1 Tax=Aegicerativicinus sediminis TaxID=2893202 RepID=UPI001E4B487D|nr:caspase family protein [Aegicerativicinus sediminis]